MVARFLITTALEETWPSEREPVLFLGEWCLLRRRKHRWENMDGIVAPYHWDDRLKLHQDFSYIQSLYEEFLSKLEVKLNEIHRTDYSNRYWRILVGPWLAYFLQMIFDRWESLSHVFISYEISDVRKIKREVGRLIPNDMQSFSNMYTDDAWNEMIFTSVLDWKGVLGEDIQEKTHKNDIDDVDEIKSNRGYFADLKYCLKQSLLRELNKQSNGHSSEDHFFLITSYLGVKQDLLLQAKLGQMPKIWRSVAAPPGVYDLKTREWRIFPEKIGDEFAEFAANLIPTHIPKLYLEGYRDLTNLVDQLPWTKNPKVIFTSNSYSTDDIFKAWAAKQVDGGAALVIGQHGGNYGMAAWSFEEDHQVAISDKFLTWGWGDLNCKVVNPLGKFKPFKGGVKPDPKGLILMIEMLLPRYSYQMYSAPVASQVSDYFEDQYRFVAALPEELRNHLLVRLFPQDFKWDQSLRWYDQFPEVKLESGGAQMHALMKKSRVCISTYNATSYLETMSANFPTIIFWNPNHWELRDSAVPYFELLKAVGVFHDSAEQAAGQLASVWTDIPGWWASHEVQDARQAFCDRYAKRLDDPLKALTNFFKEFG